MVTRSSYYASKLFSAISSFNSTAQPEIRDSMAATHAHRCRTRSQVTNESQNHYKENSALSANLLLIIAPVLQPPEETSSSRSQNKVDYMYNLSLRALCAFACVKAVPEAIFVGRRNPRTPPYIFLITVRRQHKLSKINPLHGFRGMFFQIELICSHAKLHLQCKNRSH